ncbi:MAG: hypothetical protein HYV97_08005 [Bdellovibrio sp.]|nr:hypothetical protein [Bdellovibrio sp.]
MKGLILVVLLLTFLNSAFSASLLILNPVHEPLVSYAHEVQLKRNCGDNRVYSNDLGICFQIVSAEELRLRCPENQVPACDPDTGKGCKCVCSYGLLCDPDNNASCVCNPYPPYKP